MFFATSKSHKAVLRQGCEANRSSDNFVSSLQFAALTVLVISPSPSLPRIQRQRKIRATCNSTKRPGCCLYQLWISRLVPKSQLTTGVLSKGVCLATVASDRVCTTTNRNNFIRGMAHTKKIGSIRIIMSKPATLTKSASIEPFFSDESRVRPSGAEHADILDFLFSRLHRFAVLIIYMRRWTKTRACLETA
eukprot:29148_1